MEKKQNLNKENLTFNKSREDEERDEHAGVAGGVGGGQGRSVGQTRDSLFSSPTH